MSDFSRKIASKKDLMIIYQMFLKSLLDTAYFHGGLLVLGAEEGAENGWLKGDVRSGFFKIGFEAHFVYRIAVFDSLLNSLTSLILCHKPGVAIGDRDIKAGRLLSASRGQIVAEYIDARVKQLSRESFVNRIRELERFLKVDFGISPGEYAELKNGAATRNRIVHEGSSFEFTVNEDMSVVIKEKQPERISAKDWAYFHFLEPLGVKITAKVAEVLFGADEAASFGKTYLHDLHPDGFIGHAIPQGRHKAYEIVISGTNPSKSDASATGDDA